MMSILAAAVVTAAAPKSEYKVTAVIHAPKDKVWAILTDAPNYPKWVTALDGVDGKIAKDEHLVVHLKAMKDQKFDLTVTDFQPGAQMVWTGGMPLGLFKAERTYKLTELKDGWVQFDMREAFSGPMAGMIVPSLPDMQGLFDDFAAGLKKRAEAN